MYFTESDWFEEDEAAVFNFTILDINKKIESLMILIVSLSECLKIFLMIQGIAMS